VQVIGGLLLAILFDQLPVEHATAQNYLPQQQAVLPQQQGNMAPQQGAPSAPMCVYPNGASCPMATDVLPGTSCTCQQVWPGAGQVAGGSAAQQSGMPQAGGSWYQSAPPAEQPSLLTPPPADMVPIQ
jgi:hypothetical protein